MFRTGQFLISGASMEDFRFKNRSWTYNHLVPHFAVTVIFRHFFAILSPHHDSSHFRHPLMSFDRL